MITKRVLFLAMLTLSSFTQAGDVTIQHAEFSRGPADWTVNVTLKHADEGWQHYADAWRVVDGKGKVLANRTLWHPHVDEQPFTRSQSGVNIPASTSRVYVEAHDKVHGWSKDRLMVDLSKASGDRFKVKR